MHPPRNTARLRRVGSALVAVLTLLAALRASRAADPQPYEVAIAPTGDAMLDKALTAASSLESLREPAPVGPFPLLARARGDEGRFLDVLHGLGHYAATVAISIDGLALADPTLPAKLDAAPANPPVKVSVTITPGPVFKLRLIRLEGDVPKDMQSVLGLSPGDPAVAADVLSAGARLLTALRDSGHALARVPAPIATLDPAAQALDVTFNVQAGPRVALGDISVSGLTRLHESYLRRRLGLSSGQPYSPAAIAQARQDLADSGLFSTIRVEPAQALDAAGRLPVAVDVKERKLRTVNLGASFSTDEGGSLTAAWTHRDLWGEAEKLTISGALTELGGTANRQPGYNLGAVLALPDWRRRDQTLSFNVMAMRQYLDAYDRTGITAGATLSRKLDKHLTVSLGLTTTLEEVTQEGERNTYRLLQVPLSLTYDTTTSLLDPTSGMRAGASLTPTLSLGNGSNSMFLIGQASASAYFDFGTKGRSVLALRGLVGVAEGAGVFAIPPDQRFYAGGGGSVRGFRYQSLGKQFASGRPVGGNAVDVGSVEFRQRIGASWGAVAFLDAGQISSDAVPFAGSPKVGVGTGVRYYTSIGPIRLDVAVPLTRERKADAFELYIGLGQAF
jgi:translocation and assembly module TamA